MRFCLLLSLILPVLAGADLQQVNLSVQEPYLVPYARPEDAVAFSLLHFLEAVADIGGWRESPVNVKMFGDKGGMLDVEFPATPAMAFEMLMHPDCNVSFDIHLEHLARNGSWLDYLTSDEIGALDSGAGLAVILSGAGLAALDNHTDPFGVAVRQLAGSKDWTYCSPTCSPLQVDWPVGSVFDANHMSALHQEARPGDCNSATLSPGDKLYLPRGTIHSARTPTSSTSAHLVVCLPTGEAAALSHDDELVLDALSDDAGDTDTTSLLQLSARHHQDDTLTEQDRRFALIQRSLTAKNCKLMAKKKGALCGLALLDKKSSATTVGQVKALLLKECQYKGYKYSTTLCTEAIKRLLKNVDSSKAITTDTSYCAEVANLLTTHWCEQAIDKSKTKSSLMEEAHHQEARHLEFAMLGNKACV